MGSIMQRSILFRVQHALENQRGKFLQVIALDRAQKQVANDSAEAALHARVVARRSRPIPFGGLV